MCLKYPPLCYCRSELSKNFTFGPILLCLPASLLSPLFKLFPRNPVCWFRKAYSVASKTFSFPFPLLIGVGTVCRGSKLVCLLYQPCREVDSLQVGCLTKYKLFQGIFSLGTTFMANRTFSYVFFLPFNFFHYLPSTTSFNDFFLYICRQICQM